MVIILQLSYKANMEKHKTMKYRQQKRIYKVKRNRNI